MEGVGDVLTRQGDDGVSLPRWLRLAVAVSPLVFLLHDLEELLTLDRWPALPGPVRSLAPVPDPATFTGAVAFLFLLQAAAAAWLLVRRSRGAARVFALLAGARLVNALVHLGRAAILGTYASGLWTAGLVAAPFGALLMVAVGRRLEAGAGQWAGLVIGAAVVQLPVILLALGFGRWVAGLA